jgi:1,4-alpha-glucan branching enzyme
MQRHSYLCLILHTHLPYVHHPEVAHFTEESWLFEAITESYIPLLDMCERLSAENIPLRLTLSVTPTLIYMLRSASLQQRYVRHLQRLTELAKQEVQRTRFDAAYRDLAESYLRYFQWVEQRYSDHHGGDLLGALRQLQERGDIELIASCATHGFLPHLAANPTSIAAQIHLGIDVHIRTFGQPPAGFWLPECGYMPGFDALLARHQIRYFVVDAHALLDARPAPPAGVYAPVQCPSGVAAFARDPASSRQVWSSHEGYPGDADYREYHRDIGHELEYDYIRPHIHPLGQRINTGIKYWRVTGRGEEKLPYDPQRAAAKARQHAQHFIAQRQQHAVCLTQARTAPPVFVAPYDTELFGHWWHEGPQWLEALLRGLAQQSATIATTTPGQYLDKYPATASCQPIASSWGQGGHGEYWLNPRNDWIYPYLHAAGAQMKALAQRHADLLRLAGDGNALLRRALHQAARELLLAEASDWPFIMTADTVVAYARRRITSHLQRFDQLRRGVLAGQIDEAWLHEIECRDALFADLTCARYYLADGWKSL